MSKKEEKAMSLIDDERIFKVQERERYVLYTCRGSKGDIYDIFYRKDLGRWSCKCDNIKETDCYHITAAKKLMDWEKLLDFE